MSSAAARRSAGIGRHEFLLLDGLRGIAALAVLIYHAQDWFAGGYLFSHGYMAVDFFFVLSGFVVAHAYGDRLRSADGLRAFATARVVRLYPLLVLGAVLGIGIDLLRLRALGLPFDRYALADCIASLVPFPALWREALFPIDPAVWSLFWELVVNAAFAIVLYRLRSIWLFLLALALAALLIGKSVATGGVEFGPFRDGWEFGGVRAFYGFILGVLVLRHLRAHPPRRTRRLGWVAGVVALMLSAMPGHGGWSMGYDVFLMILINPLVVFAAAHSAPVAPRLEAWSGAISYPLYIIHTPILLLVGGVLTRLHASDHIPKWLIGLFILIALVAISDALNRWFDVPLRRYLRRRVA